MPIPSTRYVEITSAVIGASSVAVQSLTGRRFTSNPLVPTDHIVTVLNGGAQDYFGAQTPEARFAAQYFSYVSPAPASKANNLQYAAYAPAGRAPTLFGAPNNSTLAALQAVTTGSLSIQLGDAAINLTGINLSTALTFADVASLLQTAIRAAVGPQYTAALVTYDSLTEEFKIVGSVVAAADAAVLAAPVGTDIGSLISLGGVGSVQSPGVAAQSPLQAFILAEAITDSFGSASFQDSMTLEQAVDLATYVAGQNIKYQLYLSVSRADYETWSAALINIPSVGLILNATANEYKESLPQAIMAATDYDRRNATVNYMYRQSALTGDVTDGAESLDLDAARVNYYGTTASAGQRISFFQRGFLMGGATAALDMNVHANEQWLKAFMAARFLAMELSTGKIPANNEGRGMCMLVIAEGVDRAKFNGTISVGKLLSSLQQIAITELTGDALAYLEVQNNGYWTDVAMVEVTGPGGIPEYVAKYTLVYSKNDVVRKIEGSHNLV